MLLETGSATAGRLGELMGLTTGAVTRMVDRLEQAGYVRRVADPTDRRRVVVEPIPERVATVRELIDAGATAAIKQMAHYSPDQLEAIQDFLERMAENTRAERERIREGVGDAGASAVGGEHAAPVGGLREARLLFRSGASDLTLGGDAGLSELYRARFEGAVPQVRLRDGVVTVQYRGGLLDFRRRKADLILNGSVSWDLEFQGGLSSMDARLTDVLVRSIEITGGASKVDIRLGRPDGIVPIKIRGGASELRIRRPSNSAARLSVEGGATRLELDGQKVGGTSGATLESTGAAKATDAYAISVVGGVSKLSVGTLED
jgi:DNA-binding MarR family transcriptional regulator